MPDQLRAGSRSDGRDGVVGCRPGGPDQPVGGAAAHTRRRCSYPSMGAAAATHYRVGATMPVPLTMASAAGYRFGINAAYW